MEKKMTEEMEGRFHIFDDVEGQFCFNTGLLQAHWEAPIRRTFRSALRSMLLTRANDVNFESVWKEIGGVCRAAIRCEKVEDAAWCASFSPIRLLCSFGRVSEIFKLYEAVSEVLSERLGEVQSELAQADNDCFLPCFKRLWDNFHCGLQYLDGLFKNFNDHLMFLRAPFDECDCGDLCPIEGIETENILQRGLSMWRSVLIGEVWPQLASCLLSAISKNRSGIVSHQDCIPACLESFLFTDAKKNDLSRYAHLFHKALMKNTRVFYSEWSTRACAQPCSDFISEALEVLSHETGRASKYYPQFREQLVNLFGEVIVQQQRDFLHVWVSELINTKQKDALRRLCQLLKTTNQPAMLQHLLGVHVKAKVNSLLAGIPNDISAHTYFVIKLLAEHNQFMEFIDQSLEGSPSFRDEVDEAFKQAINSSSPIAAADTDSRALASASNKQTLNPIRAAQYMNDFIDEILTHSEKQSLANEELGEKISAAIILMGYIEAKDPFWEYYQNGLRRRLLLNSSTSLELEESTVAKLREVYYHESAFKCKLMISDIQSAEDLNDGFQKYLVDSNISLPIPLHCNVLGASYWPLEAGISTISFNHTPFLENCRSHFDAFYKSKYSNRRLRWDLSACTAECKLLYTEDGRQYTLQLAAVHTAVFAHFEAMGVDEMTLGHLRLHLLPAKSASPVSAEVKRDEEEEEAAAAMVKPLVDAGFLKFLPPHDPSSGDEYTNASVISLNRAYTNPDAKLNFISEFSLHNSDQEKREDRKTRSKGKCDSFIQSAIVRILKRLKRLQHADLLRRIQEEDKCGFKPSIIQIKNSIEKLIAQGFVERNPHDFREYRYLE